MNPERPRPSLGKRLVVVKLVPASQSVGQAFAASSGWSCADPWARPPNRRAMMAPSLSFVSVTQPTPTFHVGTSGFSYDEWRPAFYPDDLKKDRMLAFYAERLPAVELNNTFYRLPSAKMAANWRAQVPASFRFVVKASQRLTWTQKLKDCGELLQVLFRALEPLGDTLGCVFYQVPKWVRKDVELLREFLALQPASLRIAFEFAHASWSEDDALVALRERNAAVVASDKDDGPEPVLHDTADWAYVRLRRSAYDDVALRAWRQRVSERAPGGGFVFFKHEDSCAGPALAKRFLAL
jgi:uncharacterized protein YecE (DUF72 family)